MSWYFFLVHLRLWLVTMTNSERKTMETKKEVQNSNLKHKLTTSSVPLLIFGLQFSPDILFSLVGEHGRRTRYSLIFPWSWNRGWFEISRQSYFRRNNWLRINVVKDSYFFFQPHPQSQDQSATQKLSMMDSTTASLFQLLQTQLKELCHPIRRPRYQL